MESVKGCDGKDCNGIEIHTGDIVRITGDYVKKYNCYYMVADILGKNKTAGRTIELNRISKMGQRGYDYLRVDKYPVYFWPVFHYGKNEPARARAIQGGWKEEDVKIEVVKKAADFFRLEIVG